MENIKTDFATVHNDDTSQHKSKSFSLSSLLGICDQSIEEPQSVKKTNDKSEISACGVDGGAQHLLASKSNQIKYLTSNHHHHHHHYRSLKTKTELESSITSLSESEETAFEFPVDYSKNKEISSENASQLRKILGMKSPGINEETTLMQGTVLNLSKETSFSATVTLNSSSLSSNPSAIFLQSNSPRPAKIPNMSGKSANESPNQSPLPPPLHFGQNFSPIMNQTVPGTSMMIPLPYDNLSPTLFSGHNFPALGQGSPVHLPPLVPSLQLPVLAQITQKAKTTRPFKAYPKDPLSLPPLGFYGLASSTTTTTDVGVSQHANQAYNDFRKRMLASSQIGKSKNMARNNSSPYQLPSPSVSLSSNGTDEMSLSSDDANLEMSERSQVEKSNNQLKDDAYWERRRKNNLAAKRSRDARRAKEDEIAIRAAFLEQENLKLRFEVCALKNETAKLRCMLYS